MRKQGLDDSPLTDKGRSQADRYGRLLDALLDEDGITPASLEVHVSPLGRTRVTASYLIDILGLAKHQVHVEPRLVEFDYGAWSGLTNEEIEREYPGALDARELNKWHYRVPDGESYADVEAKVDDWLSELDDSRVIVAVTHSVVSRVIRGKYGKMDYQVASRLDHHQDCIYRLRDGSIEQFEINTVKTISLSA